MINKWLSRNVVVDNEPRGLAIVSMDTKGKIEVSPFVREEEGVVYVSEQIIINTTGTEHKITFVKPEQSVRTGSK